MPTPLNQDETFVFYLITRHSFQFFNFCWNKGNERLHIAILNTCCGWDFVQEWRDDEYKFPTGKVIRMTDTIRSQAQKLKDDFMQNGANKHKKQIHDFAETLGSLCNGEYFFFYRVVYSYPNKVLVCRILTELQYLNTGKSKKAADEWFRAHAAAFFNDYDFNQYIEYKQGEKEKEKRECRFCHRKTPETSFNNVSHAIPESIGGNRNLICYEECDECNKAFGASVESNLCNWFDFRRSQMGVRRKHGGIPNAYGRNYIIENQMPQVVLDKEANFNEIKAIGSKPVTLQGIYRALCKIAIDLIDSKHLPHLQTTIEWIRFGNPKSAKYPQVA